MIPIRLSSTVGVEGGGVAGCIESVRSMKVSGSEGDGGGISNLDMEVGRSRKDAVLRGCVRESVSVLIRISSEHGHRLTVPDDFSNPHTASLMHEEHLLLQAKKLRCSVQTERL